MFKGSKGPKHADRPFLFVMYFVKLRPTFNLRQHLEVKEYCEGQNLSKCHYKNMPIQIYRKFHL